MPRSSFLTSTRRGAAVAGLVLAVLVLQLLVAGPSSAETVTRTKTLNQGYSTSGVLKFYKPRPLCARWTTDGVLSFRATYKYEDYASSPPTYRYQVDRVALSFNRLKVRFYKMVEGRCTDQRWTYAKVRLTEFMKGYACDFNPSFSLSAPWGATVSAWPSCGDKKVGKWSESSDQDSWTFELNRSENEVRYTSPQTQVYGSKRTDLRWKCYGAYGRVAVSSTTSSDSLTTPRVRVCPTWNGSTAIF